MSERQYSEHLTCSVSTKQKLLSECKESYLKAHPEMKGISLSQGYLLDKVVDFYLRSW